MDDESVAKSAIDPSVRPILRAGAVCGFVVVAGYLATFPLYAWVGAPPSTGLVAQLEYFGARATGWWIIAGLMVATDLLLLPFFLAIYHALKGVGHHLMMLAVSCIALFVAVDVAITWTAHSTLIAGGTQYVAATSAAAKAAVLAGVAYPSAVLDTPIAGFGAIVLPSLGILLAGLAMRRGAFGKPAVYLALITGVTAFVFMGSYVAPALEPLRIVNALLVTAWYVLAAIGLLRLARR